MMDMLNILQEYQEKKTSKTTSRVAAVEAKKKEIKNLRNAEIHLMKEEGRAYIAQVKARIVELRGQEVSPESTFVDISVLFANRTRCIEPQLDLLSHFLSELSPARLEVIEENSADGFSIIPLMCQTCALTCWITIFLSSVSPSEV
ncbi:hypothetical protein JB92DRAFT_670791 [Gautieria morchelliformis]|nr:hypothetical protein JB92DRAFT_670791 [Gautieria morchelliformis]